MTTFIGIICGLIIGWLLMLNHDTDRRLRRTAKELAEAQRRLVSPNPPATEPASEQAATQQAKAFSPTLFWSHMRTLAEHLDAAVPLLRELLAHLPADLRTSVSADDVDRLQDLAATARVAVERAKQGKAPA